MKYLLNKIKHNVIASICEKYGVINYTINSDRTVDVNGDVFLYNYRLTRIPLEFGRVSCDFSCSRNKLTSLKGCPEYVGRGFSCSNNELTSLKGCPKHVGGFFNCIDNQITSLQGCPEHVDGNFHCDNNKITSLEGFPKHIGGNFNCQNNPIWEIWDLFRDMSKIELFNDYDIIRDDGKSIVMDRLNDFLITIGRKPVKNVNGYKNI